MSNIEFAEIVAFVEAGCGKPLAKESQMVYFELLGDLDYSVLRIAASRVMTEHVWATFPSIAELRQAAVETLRGEVKELSPGEAWEKAWAAIAEIDPELPHTIERAKKHVPKAVWESIEAFGVLAMCYGDEPVGVIRGQFMKIYEGIAARERRKALLPPSTLAALDDIRERQAIPGNNAIAGVLAGIGKGIDAA